MARERIIDLQRRGARQGTLRMGEQTPRGPRARETWLATTPNEDVAVVLSEAFEARMVPFENDRSDDVWAVDTGTARLDVLIDRKTLTQRYEMYSRAGLQRNCDGQFYTDPAGERHECACDGTSKDDCKLTTRFAVVLPTVAVLGTFLVTTHSEFAARELLFAFDQLTEYGSHVGAARLTIEKRSMKKPNEKHTRRYALPVLAMPHNGAVELTTGHEAPALPSGDELAVEEPEGVREPLSDPTEEETYPGDDEVLEGDEPEHDNPEALVQNETAAGGKKLHPRRMAKLWAMAGDAFEEAEKDEALHLIVEQVKGNRSISAEDWTPEFYEATIAVLQKCLDDGLSTVDGLKWGFGIKT